jgi:hypothetical protein
MADTVEETNQAVQIITTAQQEEAAEQQAKVEMDLEQTMPQERVQEVGDTFQILKVETIPMEQAEQVESMLLEIAMVGTLMEFLQEDTAGLAQMKTEAAEEIQELSL